MGANKGVKKNDPDWWERVCLEVYRVWRSEVVTRAEAKRIAREMDKGFRAAQPMPCPPNLQELAAWPKGVRYHNKKPEKIIEYCNKWESICTQSRGAGDDKGAWHYVNKLSDKPVAVKQRWKKRDSKKDEKDEDHKKKLREIQAAAMNVGEDDQKPDTEEQESDHSK